MNPAFLKKMKRNDRFARWVITIGGMAIIFSVILILILIVKVSIPLFLPPHADIQSRIQLPAEQRVQQVLAVGMDEYLETGYSIDTHGLVHFFTMTDGSAIGSDQLVSPSGSQQLLSAETYGRLNYSLLWADGSITIEQIKFTPFFDENKNNQRSIRHKIEQRAFFAAPESGPSLKTLARVNEAGRQTRIDLLADGTLQLFLAEETENLLGIKTSTEAKHQLPNPAVGQITALTLTKSGEKLFAGTDQGEILRWDLSDIENPVLDEVTQAFADRRKITALNMVFGDVSLSVGDSSGALTTWFTVRTADNSWKLTRIHDLDKHTGPVQSIGTTLRDKSVASLADDGIKISYMTSERFLLGLSPPGGIAKFSLTTRGDGLVALTKQGQLISWKLAIPHPEISFKTLFGKVWYEGYPAPAYVWQSSSGSDDYEPKLSLTPLIYGTLKGTFYAMLFAVPLAILGAIYTSQFARPRFKGIVKPAVEIMAAVPTVIIGFLAALWLAPMIERSLGSLFLSIILVPAALMVSIALWQVARKIESLQRVERGYEFLAIAPVIIIAVALAVVFGSGLENWLFDGNLKQWLFNETGTRYDPRNCIIIAFAMGFAVVPIIFTISEDALSNVPPSLRAASLALGASRWQTVWRVILPSASPGIFAGTMIGFGRAVGETMIVLMATGNTAIMDPSIFNGMRPLSANIAVEISEAPVDGSLYRTLFLSAVILFVMTFIVNTVAEIVRQRLREKYGRF